MDQSYFVKYFIWKWDNPTHFPEKRYRNPPLDRQTDVFKHLTAIHLNN
jgi:hypothetical protein